MVRGKQRENDRKNVDHGGKMLHTPRKIDEEKCKHEKPGIRGNQRGWGLTGIFSGEREGKEGAYGLPLPQ